MKHVVNHDWKPEKTGKQLLTLKNQILIICAISQDLLQYQNEKTLVTNRQQIIIIIFLRSRVLFEKYQSAMLKML